MVKSRVKLKPKQALILQLAAYFRDLTFSSAVKRISQILKIPESTVKWNMRRFRDKGLIICGDKNNQYVPLRLTEYGMNVLEVGTIHRFSRD